MDSIHEWEKVVTARKDHKCVICRQTIVSGVKYVSKTIITNEGRMKSTKFHLQCEDLLEQHLDRVDHKVRTHEDVMFEPYRAE